MAFQNAPRFLMWCHNSILDYKGKTEKEDALIDLIQKLTKLSHSQIKNQKTAKGHVVVNT